MASFFINGFRKDFPVEQDPSPVVEGLSPVSESIYLEGTEYIQLFILIVLSATVGGGIVVLLRSASERSSSRKVTHQLVTVPIVACIFIYVTLTLMTSIGKLICDSISLGMAVGICIGFMNMKVKAEAKISLTVHQLGREAEAVNLWTHPMASISEIKFAIANAVDPTDPQLYQNLRIENGRGGFVSDYGEGYENLTFIKELALESEGEDAFGHLLYSCIVHVERPCPDPLEIPEEEEEEATPRSPRERVKGMKRYIQKRFHQATHDVTSPVSRRMRRKTDKFELKFSQPIELYAKVPGADVKDGVLYVSQVGDYAGCSPRPPSAHQNFKEKILRKGDNIRIIPWGEGGGGKSRAISRRESASSLSSLDPTARTGRMPTSSGGSGSGGAGGEPPVLKERKMLAHQSGQPVRDGDTVVLECEGKFLSVARGWWIGWHARHPARSGSMTIKLVESVHEPGDSRERPIIKSGDAFRLLSAKFPGFELGMTSQKINEIDDYCYVGMRRSTFHLSHLRDISRDTWSQEVLFSGRN
jgi:hypothetical protein